MFSAGHGERLAVPAGGRWYTCVCEMSTGMSMDAGGGVGDMAVERERWERVLKLELEVLVLF